MSLSPKVAQVFTHTQTSASDTWTVVHNLGMYPIVDVYLEIGGQTNKVIPNSVTYVDANTCEIHFTFACTGFATVV